MAVINVNSVTNVSINPKGGPTNSPILVSLEGVNLTEKDFNNAVEQLNTALRKQLGENFSTNLVQVKKGVIYLSAGINLPKKRLNP